MPLSEKELHLAFKREFNQYPPQGVIEHWNNSCSPSEREDWVIYAKWLEDKLLRLMKNKGLTPPTQAFTCNGCPMKNHCEFAYDPYNKDGDCLAIK